MKKDIKTTMLLGGGQFSNSDLKVLSRTIMISQELLPQITAEEVLKNESKIKKLFGERVFNRFKNIRKKAAFTLAETLIVVAVLGVIATLTIPTLIKQQTETQNRVKVKKSMTAYEKALSSLVIENELRNNSVLSTWAQDEANSNCENATKYFKKSSGDGCIFKTSDGVWWNIENIQRPVIYLKKEGITEENKADITQKANDRDDKSALVLVGRSDDSSGAVRIDDLAFETNDPLDNSDIQVSKLFNFVTKGAVEIAEFVDRRPLVEQWKDKYGSDCGAQKKACKQTEGGGWGDEAYRFYDENGNTAGYYVENHDYYVKNEDGTSKIYDGNDNLVQDGDGRYWLSPNGKYIDCNGGECYFGSGCLARGTMITLADGSKKAIQDIDFNDELLVWDFDNGHLSKAKPLWIKVAEIATKYNLLTFSDGRTLKTINQHRIFNKEAGKYTYPMTDDTPLGTTTFLEDGSEVTLVKKEVIEEPVEFYNIMTEYHFNCFAEGISTSNRFNNLYPIKDYKFVKEEREVVPYNEYKQIPYEWYEKMRLAEQPREVNRDGADQHANSIANHILNLYIATNKRKMAVL